MYEMTPEEQQALKSFSLAGLSAAMEEMRAQNEALTKKVKVLEAALNTLSYELESLDDYVSRTARNED